MLKVLIIFNNYGFNFQISVVYTIILVKSETICFFFLPNLNLFSSSDLVNSDWESPEI